MKIAIVNDMPMAVEALRRALAFEPTHEVVWVASNGAEAVQRCAEYTPDLILMDLIMPLMDGVEATRGIMAETPCAIVIVTVDRQQNVHRVFEAMGYGALDVVDTPAIGAGNAQEAAAPLLLDDQVGDALLLEPLPFIGQILRAGVFEPRGAIGLVSILRRLRSHHDLADGDLERGGIAAHVSAGGI